MLKIFIDICGKHHLTYFAADGTLLGCIRHGGFIPWDDDIDLVMPRKDYELFLEVARQELPNDYFLQSYKTETHYHNGHIQIRDRRTTCLLMGGGGYSALKKGRNCGIFIDVFPLDYISDSTFVRKCQVWLVWFHKYCCDRRLKREKGKTLKMKVVNVMADVYNLCHSYENTLRKANRPFKKEKRTNTLAVITFAPGNAGTMWDARCFRSSVKHQFEDIEISVPLGYDQILKKEYGDYMKLPELKGNGSMHTCYFDVEKPYFEYLNLTEQEYNSLFLGADL